VLFNSYEFVLLFLPIVLLGFYAFSLKGCYQTAIFWLVGASLFFYGWWNPAYLYLLLCSIVFNYAIGNNLRSLDQKLLKKWLLTIGIVGNLSLLGYFKYANFFSNEFNRLFGTHYHLERIILPLAISFFTFQQISYLVDSYKRKTYKCNFIQYCMFVTFFPQLIAGPIVHHHEMLTQYGKNWINRLKHEHLTVGLTIFSIGLFKKVIFADGIAEFATPVFNAAQQGIGLTFFAAWGGAIAYTLQLYFDFSGYSDMAIGLARMFGIRLPLNFNSPYKANNIIEFWRCWHMTLSRFLKDYLYIPLGGNRKGKVRRYINVMITMLLGGLWHGAGWTFVMWGALHGFYLCVNHIWRAIRNALNHDLGKTSLIGRGTARIFTFVAIVVGWVFFRSESFDGAINLLSAMSGSNGISLPMSLAGKLGNIESWFIANGFVFEGMFYNELEIDWVLGIEMIILLLFLVWYAPNTQQIMIRYQPAIEIYSGEIKEMRNNLIQWKPNVPFLLLHSVVAALALLYCIRESEFLYFQF
jgi:D-alanyl-lipoteichoic acid acyltransferase DltB (MBOAT superfamily)